MPFYCSRLCEKKYIAFANTNLKNSLLLFHYLLVHESLPRVSENLNQEVWVLTFVGNKKII